MGICYDTVRVEGGWQSTMKCTSEDSAGVPYAWSGKEFKGEIFKRKVSAEHSAAGLFIKDPDVRATADNIAPTSKATRKQEMKKRWKRRAMLKHLGFGPAYAPSPLAVKK